MPEHILSLSYGKDSLACLGAIEKIGWPLDHIVTVEVWATDTIQADLPPMVEFKAKADKIIKERWGIEVEHVYSGISFERGFYFKRGRTGRKTKFDGKRYGWPMQRGQWCLQQLKLPALNKISKQAIQYIGIAIDEPNRFHNLSDTKKSPLVEAGLDRGRLPPVVRGKRPTIPHLHHGDAWRLLVLPQPERGAAPAPAQGLPGVVGADAEMGQ